MKIIFSVLIVILLILNTFQLTPPYNFYKKNNNNNINNNNNGLRSDYETFPIATTTTNLKSKNNYNLEYTKIDIFQFGQHLTGNLFKLNYPIHDNFKNFQILTTSTKGCGHREKTSKASMRNKCLAGMNAGFFNMATGGCIGNLIHNKSIIHKYESYEHSRTNFGILDNKKYIIGYLNEEDVESGKIVELVSGVLWLVRNGNIYVNKSIEIEKPNPYFCSEKAPRVSIGHDKDGHLILLEMDGYEPTKFGLSVFEMAIIMKQYGAINAINMDGGGSATAFLDGRILSKCSDKCPKSRNPKSVLQNEQNLCPNKEHCERRVSTFFCLKT